MEKQQVSHSGSCLCGAVKYKATGAVHAIENCHCNMCQKSSGSAFMTWVCMDSGNIQGTGPIRKYQSSQNVVREFCENCGSQLFFNYANRPAIRFFTLGTLEDLNALKPTSHIWFDRKPSWLCLQDNLPFENAPGT